jgi:hypothetical protein
MKKPELIYIIIFSLAISLISLYQLWMYLIKTPIGSVFPLVHNYEQDYYWYLSLMRQGWDGSLLVTSKYTPEVFAPQFVNTFFPVFGMIAHRLGMGLPAMYTSLRVVFGGGLIFASYKLLTSLKLLKELKISGMLFIIFGAPFWFVENGMIRQAGEFWTGFDPVFRITWLPHHLAANICLVVAIIFISKSFRELKSLNLLITPGLIAALCAWLNPGSWIILMMAVGIGAGIGVIRGIGEKKEIGEIKEIGRIGLFVAIAILPMLWLLHVQNSVFPWTAFRDWERFVQYPIDIVGLFGTMGITGLIGVIGVPLALSKKELLWDMIVGWFLAPIIGLSLIIKIFPISNSRFLQGAFYIPAAILTAVVVGRFGKLGKWGKYGLIGLIMMFQIPAFISSFQRQDYYINHNLTNPLIMVSQADWQAIQWLNSQGKKDAVLLAPNLSTTLIPAFTSLKVVYGHPTFTYQTDSKSAAVAKFYNHPEDNLDILSIYNIKYIWVPAWLGNLVSLENIGYKIGFKNTAVTILVKSP